MYRSIELDIEPQSHFYAVIDGLHGSVSGGPQLPVLLFISDFCYLEAKMTLES